MSKAPIHDEDLARVESQARQFGRFSLKLRFRGVDAWGKGEPTPDGNLQITDWLRPIIQAAVQCRAFVLPKKSAWTYGRKDDPFVPPLSHVREVKERMEVDLSRPEVRDDFGFWIGLVTGGRWRALMIAPTTALDFGPLLAGCSSISFGSLRRAIGTAGMDFARRAVSKGEHVAVVVGPLLQPVTERNYAYENFGLELTVFAEPALAARLACDAYRQAGIDDSGIARMDEGRHRRSPLFGRANEAHWDLRVAGGDPEKRLRTLMLRFRKRDDWKTSSTAAGAAELVALLEGRGAGHREESAKEMALSLYAPDPDELFKWVAEQDRLRVETIELAQQVVAEMKPAALADPTLRTDTAKREQTTAWKAALDDLARRLGAALRTRKVQQQAVNVSPIVTTSTEVDQLVLPENWVGAYFYGLMDDARALLDYIRDETGGTLAVGMMDGALHPLDHGWDLVQVLEEAHDGRFDAREIKGYREKHHGFGVRVWWPACSPTPTMRLREPDPPSKSDPIMELMIHPPPRVPWWETIGWGFTTVWLHGASDETVERQGVTRRELLILRSVWEYPTGTELNRPRYDRPGPWRDVDWKKLRGRIRLVRAALRGRLAGGMTAGSRPLPVLKAACAKLVEGYELADDYGHPGRVRLA